jgi:thiol-disulfide isomerase/thioredoxin
MFHSIPNIPVQVVFRKAAPSTISAEVGARVPLSELCAGRIGVIDFWHTKCTRCPAAIEKLNEMAGSFENKNVLWLTLALSQGAGNAEVVRDLVHDE